MQKPPETHTDAITGRCWEGRWVQGPMSRKGCSVSLSLSSSVSLPLYLSISPFLSVSHLIFSFPGCPCSELKLSQASPASLSCSPLLGSSHCRWWSTQCVCSSASSPWPLCPLPYPPPAGVPTGLLDADPSPVYTPSPPLPCLSCREDPSTCTPLSCIPCW